MKAVILAAGYGTRLQRDVSSDRSGRFAHLVGVPKPLLPVGRSPLISRWVRALTRSGTVDGIYVVTNALHQAAFAVWAAEFPEVQILSDETRSNEERLGAVACLQLAVKHFGIQDGVIVIGGDTLFREDFSLGRVAQKVSELQARSADSCLLLCYRCRDEETQKYGILEVDEDLRVLRMKEKPRPSETESRRACPCFYVFSKESLPLLDAFLEEKKDAPIEERDAPGNFVSWLIPRKPVFTQEISGRFDVGNLPSYLDCDVYFSETLQDDESFMV
ncbi:glucose-1-phosphate thymidylyltransferase 2 isoform X1 [Gambusia affinis]|uniref:glucose-1-phosphate thymidylyltransferase 2 isoform X1 n=1 Tax=Gambusia affinis TaxID=33528 RepID=UPI001CDBD996|nr:glucose-1-phosphate thymidylyltransferase 2 isoform X1 [Gambusia affinis]